MFPLPKRPVRWPLPCCWGELPSAIGLGPGLPQQATQIRGAVPRRQCHRCRWTHLGPGYGRGPRSGSTIENKAGANGILGAEAVKSAPADGYTFLVTTSTTQAANVSLYKKLPYDPVKDFAPIGKIGETGFILMVKSDFPANDMKQFIAHARANPCNLAYGHGSSGSLVSAAMLGQLAGLDAISVPYKGIPPALTDLLGGQIQFAFADVGNAVAQINGGKLKGLGVTTAKRAGKAPQVPPIGDEVKDYAVSAWFGLVAPAGLLCQSGPVHHETGPHTGAPIPMRKPLTGEPCAGEPHARFGGRGG